MNLEIVSSGESLFAGKFLEGMAAERWEKGCLATTGATVSAWGGRNNRYGHRNMEYLLDQNPGVRVYSVRMAAELRLRTVDEATLEPRHQR